MSGELYRAPADRRDEMLADPARGTEVIDPDDSDLDPARRVERGLDIDRARDGIHSHVRGPARRGRIPWIDPAPRHAPDESAEAGAGNPSGPICYLTPARVAEIALAPAAVGREEPEAVDDPVAMMEDRVDPPPWGRPRESDSPWEHCRSLAGSYREAAAWGEDVLPRLA